MINYRPFACGASRVLLFATALSSTYLCTSMVALGDAATESDSKVSSSGELTEMVVTTRRISENLQTVPVSVTAFGPTEISERGIVNIADVGMTTPNMHVVPPIATSNAASISVRGQIQRQNLLVVDPSVGVYVDDVYYARDYSILGDLLDVSGVEVLKGPQGTLYGRNTTGGAIKITTTAPDSNGGYSGFADASYGNFSATSFSGAFNAPIIPGVLAVRYAGSYRWHDGYTSSYLVAVNPATGNASSLTPIAKIPTDNENRYNHRLSLRFTPNDKLTVDVLGSIFHANEHGPLNVDLDGDVQNYNPGSLFVDGGISVPPNSSASVFSKSPQRQASFYAGLVDSTPSSISETKAASSTVKWDISDALQAKLIVGYVKASNISFTNSDGTVSPSFAFFNVQVAENQAAHQTSEEFQLLGSGFDKRINWIAGLYNFEEKGHEDVSKGHTYVFGQEVTLSSAYEADNKSKSAFGNVIFSATDALRVNAGARYTQDTKGIDASPRAVVSQICILTATDAFGNPNAGVTTSTTPGGPCDFVNSAKSSYATWEVGADFRISPDVFVYAKINNGVRSGGQQGFIPVGIFPAPFQPEKLVNYEAGIKSEFFNRQLRANLSVFHDRYTNIQETLLTALPDHSTAALQANKGSAKIDGLELETEARVGDQLTLSGGVGYTHITFGDPKVVQPISPKLTVDLSEKFVQPSAIGEFSERLDYAYTSWVYFDTNVNLPHNTLPGYGLVNARLGWAPRSNLELSLYGKNLVGKEYYSQAYQAAYTPGLFWGIRQAYVGAPRTYGVEANYKF